MIVGNNCIYKTNSFTTNQDTILRSVENLLAHFTWHTVCRSSEPTEICFFKSPLFLLLFFHKPLALPPHGCCHSNWFQFSHILNHFHFIWSR